MTELSEKDREVLQVIQEAIPVQSRPFELLGQRVGLSEKEMMTAIEKLKKQKFIRQISPIYDTKMVGYKSALVAFRTDCIDETAELVNSHPGVSHNYERNHDFNLWFTLAVPPDSTLGLEKTIEILAQKSQVHQFAILHSTRIFKIRVKLDMEKKSSQTKEGVVIKNATYTPLSPEEKKIVQTTQVDLPLISQPFKEYARKLKISEQKVLEKIDEFLHRGVIRRFAAILNHRKAGFKANGMAVWQVNPEEMEQVGKALAAYKGVSHCYERTTAPGWPYNLFSMIHGESRDEVEALVTQMSAETRVTQFRTLYSSREFKKVRLKYFLDDFYRWEEEIH